MKHLSPAILFLLLPLCAYAREETDTGSAPDYVAWSFEDLLNVTVTASRFEQSELEAPATTTVIDGKEIREMGKRTIPDVLATIPGIMVVQSAPGHFTVSIRGMNGMQANNVVVLLNGVRLNQEWDGEVDWGSLPVHPNSLARIEVVRGPVSVMYGANAYTGVINLITHDPRDGLSWVSTSGGADSEGNPGGTASANGGYVGDIWSLRIGLVADVDSRSELQGTGRRSGQDSYRRTGLTMVNRWDFSQRLSLTLNTAGSYAEGADFSNIIPAPSLRKTIFTTNAITLTAQRLLGDDDVFTLRGTFLGSRNYDSDQSEATEFNLGVVLDREAGLEVSYRTPEFFRSRLLIGSAMDFINVHNPHLVSAFQSQTIRQSGIFISDELNLKPILLSAGLRADFHPSVPNGKLSYRASAAWLFKEQVIRLSVGSSFRTPTFSEMGARFFYNSEPDMEILILEGNPDLKPPEVLSVELAYQSIVANRLKLMPSVFYNHLSNLIYQDFEPVIGKTYANLGTRDIIGVELGLTYLPVDNLRIGASYTFVHFIDPPEDAFNTIGYPDANPDHVANLSIMGSLVDQRLSLSLSALYRSTASYLLRAGVPPRIYSNETDHNVTLTPRVGWDIVPGDVEVYISGNLRLPKGFKESPYDDDATLNSEVFVGLSAMR